MDGHPHWLERCLDSTEPLRDQETDLGFMFFFFQMTMICWKWLNYVELDIPNINRYTYSTVYTCWIPCVFFAWWKIFPAVPRQTVGDKLLDVWMPMPLVTREMRHWILLIGFVLIMSFFVQGFDGVLMVCRTLVDIFSSYRYSLVLWSLQIFLDINFT